MNGFGAAASRARIVKILAAATALVVFGVGLALNIRFYHDDSYITLRYARNFLAGQGIVWNAGERVEGYTNFLHLMLVSGLGALGIGLKAATQIIGFGSLLLMLGVIHAYTGRPQFKGSPWRALPLISLIGSLPLVVAALAGLETTLYAALLTLGICLTLALAEAPGGRLGALAGLAFAGAALTRIEGALFFAISLAFVWQQSRRLAPGRHVAAMALVFGAVFGTYFLWRWNYYGAFLPNTFYVKTGGLSLIRLHLGVFYVLTYAATPPFLFPAAAAALLLAHRRRALTPAMGYLAVLISVFLCYVIYVGGDHLQGFRFIIPVIPAASLLLFVALSAAAPAPRRRQALPYAAALVALVLQFFGPTTVSPRADGVVTLGVVIGQHIKQHWPRGALIALSPAGTIPYYAADYRYIDMLGLNDAHIGRREIGEPRLAYQDVPGHAKGDGAYVLARQPDYIILGTVYGVRVENPLFLSDLELKENPAFLKQYRERQVVIDVSDVPDNELALENDSGKLILTYYERIK